MQKNNGNENYQIKNDPYASQKDLNYNQEQQLLQLQLKPLQQHQQQQHVNSGPQTSQQGYSQNNVHIPIMTVPTDNDAGNNIFVLIIKKDERKPQPMLGPFERHSMRIKCENCNLVVESKIIAQPGPGAQCCSIILCCLCTWPLCCCFVPYCCGDGCRDIYHHCPRCDALIGQTLFTVKK